MCELPGCLGKGTVLIYYESTWQFKRTASDWLCLSRALAVSLCLAGYETGKSREDDGVLPMHHVRYFECYLVSRMDTQMFRAQEEIYLVYLSGR